MEEPRARAGSDGVCVGHPAGPSEPQHPQGSEGRGEALPFVGLSQGIEEEAPFECPVCLHLMFAPTTLHCGHSLCNSCLVSCMQHAARCPVCRVDLPAQMSSPATSLALQKALEKLFPKEYAARAAEESARSHYSRTAPTIAHHSLPLFVLEPLLPRQQMKLHIFEPRYVTLTQRVMASADRCFGMVAMDTTMPIYGSGAVYPRPASVGVLVRVLACQPLPYGRFLVHIEGVRRFRTLRTWEVDGYLSAQVAWYADHNFEDSDEHVLAQLLGAELLSVLEEWSAEVKKGKWEHARDQLAMIRSQLGPMPTLSKAEELGLWAAAFINPLPPLGVAPEIRLPALMEQDSVARLRDVLRAAESSLGHLRTPRHPLVALTSQVLTFTVDRAAGIMQTVGPQTLFAIGATAFGLYFTVIAPLL